ncbi:24186_t:CDS:1, partial [Gigaspora margarita]
GDADIYCPFLETLVKKSHYTCQGVKICENLNVDIKNKTHCEVDMDVDLLQSTNNSLDIQRTRKAKTY